MNGMNDRDSHSLTFTPFILFFGPWLIASSLLIWLTALPVWAAILLGLLIVILLLRLMDAIF